MTDLRVYLSYLWDNRSYLEVQRVHESLGSDLSTVKLGVSRGDGHSIESKDLRRVRPRFSMYIQKWVLSFDKPLFVSSGVSSGY